MLPDDPNWRCFDGNMRVRNGLLNDLQRSVGAEAASSAEGTFPAPTGSTLPWGGGHIIIGKRTTALSTGTNFSVDASRDYRNRLIRIQAICAWDAAGKVPGEGSEPNDQALGLLRDADIAMTRPLWYTKSGSDNPGVAGYYYSVASGGGSPPTWGYLYANAAAPYDLRFHNVNGTDLYLLIAYTVFDQFPTRT